MKKLKLFSSFTTFQLFALAASLLLGIALRLYQLGSLPNGLYWDETAVLVDAISVSQTGLDMHGRPWYQIMYPSYGDYKLPVYIWLSAASVKVFGASEWAVRLPSAVAGILTMIVASLIALQLGKVLWPDKERMQNWLSIVAAFTMAVSPWSILFSRTGFEAHIGQLILGGAALALVSTKSKWRWVLAALLGGVATYAYFSVRFVWPAMLLGYVLWHIVSASKLSLKKIVLYGISITVSFSIFGVTLLPMLRSPLYTDSNRFRLSTASVLNADDEVLQSNIYREMAGNTVVDRFAFHRYWLVARNLGSNYADNLDIRFLFFIGDANLRHGTGYHGLFLVPFILPFLWGWYWLLRKQAGLAVWLGIWWLAALLPASVPETTPHALRSLNALIPLVVVMSVGVVSVFDEVPKRMNRLAKIVLLGWLVWVGYSLLQFWQYYTVIYPALANESWQGQYRELAKTISAQDMPVKVITFDDRFYLWLLAYGNWQPEEWQQWPSQGFIFTDLPGVSNVSATDWNKASSEATLWVGKTETIETVATSTPEAITHILDFTGKPRFSTVSRLPTK